MISGVVKGDFGAAVRLKLRGAGSREQEIEAILDTGFNGFLTLPPNLIKQLDLPHIGQTRVLLANGKEELLDLYEVSLFWDDRWLAIEADAAETEALVGMALLHRYSLYVEVVEGGRIVIEALS